ncbi:MAG: ABC transporter permease subunit [Anaerolineae bacterium]|jgi:peptide/nickel transport system permease protein
MAKFIIRRLLLMLLTMLFVSIAVFLITEAAPGNVARNVLGIHITPEQEASFLNQQGLDEPFYVRYFNWLAGTDWRASAKVGMDVRQITTEDGFREWWAVQDDGSLTRWEMTGEDLIAQNRQPDGSVVEQVDNERWSVKDPAVEIERLEAYRAELVDNAQVADEDRRAVLEKLDEILRILSDEEESQETLASALEGPESALEGMVDEEALHKKSVFREMAEDVERESDLVQVLAARERLSGTEAGQLGQSDLQSMARQLNRAAETLEGLNPTLVERLQKAAAALEDGDIAAARETLDAAAKALDQLIGSLGSFLYALQSDDYEPAVGVLEDLSDPSQTPLDAARLTVLPGVLEAIGEALEDDALGLAEPLLQAVDDLRAGNTADARQSLSAAATVLAETGRAIVRSEAAQGARVGRVFWGIDTKNHAVQWEKGTGQVVWRLVPGSGWLATTGGPVEYIPLQKGLIRGDPGLSLRTGRPVADLLFTRLRNSLVLAGIAFVIVMPLALVLGLIAGLNQGKAIDRILSIGGMMFSVTPQFVTGIFLILIFAFWLDLVPGATVFGEQAPWQRPEMLILPVATLTLIELGYVLRITRASMADVMREPYIRTAYLKGLPHWRVVFRHAVRNALMAPITVIMLHVNWLLGGIVVVEVIFGYPGLGSYILQSALFKDFNAIEGGAIILVAVAVSTQLLADILYTFLNPRIRFG